MINRRWYWMWMAWPSNTRPKVRKVSPYEKARNTFVSVSV